VNDLSVCAWLSKFPAKVERIFSIRKAAVDLDFVCDSRMHSSDSVADCAVYVLSCCHLLAFWTFGWFASFLEV
jgi:hypothetical protein